MNNNFPDKQSNFLLYTGNDGNVNVEVFLKDETVWLTQKAIGRLFGKSKATISEHLKKIYAEGELQMDSTVRKFRTVQMEGSRQIERDLEYYNLDAIISVGYRVNSYQATQFRIWATRTLKEFIIKGFVLDDERLKQGCHYIYAPAMPQTTAHRNDNPVIKLSKHNALFFNITHPLTPSLTLEKGNCGARRASALTVLAHCRSRWSSPSVILERGNEGVS